MSPHSQQFDEIALAMKSTSHSQPCVAGLWQLRLFSTTLPGCSAAPAAPNLPSRNVPIEELSIDKGACNIF